MRRQQHPDPNQLDDGRFVWSDDTSGGYRQQRAREGDEYGESHYGGGQGWRNESDYRGGPGGEGSRSGSGWNRNDLQPGGRGPRWGHWGGSAGEHDLGPELFGIGGGSESARQSGRGGYERDEPFYGQTHGLRQGFGHHEMPRDDWSSSQADVGAPLPASIASDYGASGGWEQWRDVARDRLGPRGYVRSDERIREFICERLAQHHQLDVSDVSVEVSNGCVTLEGTVPERGMKYRIEDTADSCWGVKEVENHIRVQHRDEQSGQQWRSGAGG